MAKKKPKSHRKPLLRPIARTDHLAPSELKRIFARNLDQLIRVVGLKRTEAAEQIGIPYRLIRRLVTAGVSRLDKRNEENIQRIVKFFVLQNSDELWQPDLLSWILNPDYRGSKFIEHFQDGLDQVLEQHAAKTQKIDEPLLRLINGALGVEQKCAGYWGKVEAILASPKAEQFRCLIDDYYELISVERKATG